MPSRDASSPSFWPCNQPSAQSLKKGHRCVFLPRRARLAFPAFPQRMQSAGTNSGQEELEGKLRKTHWINAGQDKLTVVVVVVGSEKMTANQLSESSEWLQRFASGHWKKQPKSSDCCRSGRVLPVLSDLTRFVTWTKWDRKNFLFITKINKIKFEIFHQPFIFFPSPHGKTLNTLGGCSHG